MLKMVAFAHNYFLLVNIWIIVCTQNTCLQTGSSILSVLKQCFVLYADFYSRYYLSDKKKFYTDKENLAIKSANCAHG